MRILRERAVGEWAKVPRAAGKVQPIEGWSMKHARTCPANAMTNAGLPFALLVLLLLLVGCVPTRPLATGWTDFDFHVRGRIGGRSAHEAFSASFDWRQAEERFAVELWGMLGQGRTRILSDGRRALVINARGQVLRDDNLDDLMARALGWHAPVLALRHWVRGMAAPRGALEAVAHDEQGRLARFTQFGWAVELRGWQDTPVGETPRKIIAQRGNYRVVVVSKEWFGPSAK